MSSRRDKLTPRNVDRLHELLAEVMVRNRRSTVGLQFTRRWAKTMSVPLTPDEGGLYRRVTDFVRQHLRAGLRTLFRILLEAQEILGAKFLEADGSINREIMYDYLHLTPKGYQIWADAIAGKVAELMM